MGVLSSMVPAEGQLAPVKEGWRKYAHRVVVTRNQVTDSGFLTFMHHVRARALDTEAERRTGTQWAGQPGAPSWAYP